jgi:hypothetical protein
MEKRGERGGNRLANPTGIAFSVASSRAAAIAINFFPIVS